MLSGSTGEGSGWRSKENQDLGKVEKVGNGHIQARGKILRQELRWNGQY